MLTDRDATQHSRMVGDAHVVVDPRFLRPAEVDVLHGDADKARQRLGWTPAISLPEMVAEMVDADLARHRARLAR